MTASILQSEPWARFQRSLGKEVFERSGDGWTFLAIMEKTPLGRFLYVPYGPAAADHAALVRALAALRALAGEQRAHYVRIEPVRTDLGQLPQAALQSLGLVKAPVDVQPKLTWMLDLNGIEPVPAYFTRPLNLVDPAPVVLYNHATAATMCWAKTSSSAAARRS